MTTNPCNDFPVDLDQTIIFVSQLTIMSASTATIRTNFEEFILQCLQQFPLDIDQTFTVLSNDPLTITSPSTAKQCTPSEWYWKDILSGLNGYSKL